MRLLCLRPEKKRTRSLNERWRLHEAVWMILSAGFNVFYGRDFSACVKELLSEKIEDSQDVGFIQRIKEGKQENYFSAGEVHVLFPK